MSVNDRISKSTNEKHSPIKQGESVTVRYYTTEGMKSSEFLTGVVSRVYLKGRIQITSNSNNYHIEDGDVYKLSSNGNKKYLGGGAMITHD